MVTQSGQPSCDVLTAWLPGYLMLSGRMPP